MTATPARLFAATCLVLTALLSAISVLTQPEFSADPAERLAGIDAAGAAGAVSLLAFVLAQLPFMVAAVAIALMAASRSPRRPSSVGALAVLGGFGHAVFGGIGLAYLAMVDDAANREAIRDVVTRIESGRPWSSWQRGCSARSSDWSCSASPCSARGWCPAGSRSRCGSSS